MYLALQTFSDVEAALLSYDRLVSPLANLMWHSWSYRRTFAETQIRAMKALGVSQETRQSGGSPAACQNAVEQILKHYSKTSCGAIAKALCWQPESWAITIVPLYQVAEKKLSL